MDDKLKEFLECNSERWKTQIEHNGGTTKAIELLNARIDILNQKCNMLSRLVEMLILDNVKLKEEKKDER